MKPSIAAACLLGSVFVSACATEVDDAGVDIDVVAAPADSGKFDAISGHQFRFHHVEAWVAAEKGGVYADLATDQSMKINVATDTVAVVSGKSWAFSEYNWPADTILKLSATPRPGAKTAASMLLVLIDDTEMKPVTCDLGNLFASVALDPVAQEIHVDGEKTFTYAQCGLKGTRPSIDVFVVPASTSGSLEGEYKFRLNASNE